MRFSVVARAALAAVVVLGWAPASFARDYKGTTISLIVATGPGGGYAQVGQLLARHMPKHLAGNPTMIVQFQPAAAGLQAANYLYNAAPQDGSVIALLRNSTTFGQAMKLSGVKYDAGKFHWIGSVEPVVNVLGARKKSGVMSLADLQKKELIVGAAGKLDTLYIFPTVMQKMLGYKFKVVSGYRGTNDVFAALDRNEVGGMVQPYDNWETSHLHREGEMVYLTQFSYERIKRLSSTPTMVELARNPDERKILRLVSVPSVLGRNVAAPPKAPADRVAILRTAFDATMKDQAFINEMHKGNRSVEPLSGDTVENMVKEVLSTPDALIERTRAYLGY